MNRKGHNNWLPAVVAVPLSLGEAYYALSHGLYGGLMEVVMAPYLVSAALIVRSVFF